MTTKPEQYMFFLYWIFINYYTIPEKKLLLAAIDIIKSKGTQVI